MPKFSIFLIVAFVGLLIYLVVIQERIYDGEVTDKEYYPAHTTVEMSYITVGHVSMPTWHDVYHPPAWYITFKKYSEKSERWLYSKNLVTKDAYNNFQIGDYISFK